MEFNVRLLLKAQITLNVLLVKKQVWILMLEHQWLVLMGWDKCFV